MQWKTGVFAAAALIAIAAGPGPQMVRGAAASGCIAGERLDSSTADTAKKKIERAGFQQVQDLKKGCDNFWHGKAAREGAEVYVVLSPQGEVMREGD